MSKWSCKGKWAFILIESNERMKELIVFYSRPVPSPCECSILVADAADWFMNNCLMRDIVLFCRLQELYCKIESQARVVGACIRSAEKEINERQRQQLLLQQEAEVNDEQNLNSIESTSSSQQPQKRSSSSVATTVSSVKGLEKRYHLLYLKAFEIQCMLESLLNKKEEQVSDLYNYVKMMLRLHCEPNDPQTNKGTVENVTIVGLPTMRLGNGNMGRELGLFESGDLSKRYWWCSCWTNGQE